MILRALLMLALPAIAGAQVSRTDSATFADLRYGRSGRRPCSNIDQRIAPVAMSQMVTRCRPTPGVQVIET